MSVPPVLPISLTPLVCIFQSKELSDVLSDKSLPLLHQILQTFSPLQQGRYFDALEPFVSPLTLTGVIVTTRTTTFSTITHPSFRIRFADFSQLENACKEDEDERAGRIVDWIGQRITKEADRWVKSVESNKNGAIHSSDTPWWRELQICVEGDSVPTRFEGWNHPVAVILAVSTLAPNPLQAVTELHSRYKDTLLPSWVDPTRLCHTLIIHPTESPLNSDEAMALYNAVKKQYGLHTHLLPVTLESPPKPVSLPSPLPELPPASLIGNHTLSFDEPWDLNLTEADIQQFGRFVREFVTMSLIPWMERCALDWNESYIAARRLPSRFFSTTKRLFGGASTPITASSPVSHSPISTNGFGSIASSSASIPQHRRLAEFATMLGDTKLAISVWESLRKDGKSGSEVLPFLVAPTPTLTSHAISALALLQTAEFRSSHQLQALCYAIRWASGIHEFESLGGERWLEMAAGSIEEPPFALLLGQAALLSLRKGSHRKAAMWYAFAAHRLEKCGVKPLTVYFLRKAHELYQFRPSKNLSPSFEQSLIHKQIDWFDAILPSVESSLGRLTYSSGDIEGALRYFINLLKGSSSNTGEYDMTDAVYIGDFKVAFEHLKSSLDSKPIDLTPPFKLSQPTGCKVRLVQDQPKAVSPVWESFEQTWGRFWKTKGTERLDMEKKASVGERFYVDVMLTNPFDVSINLGSVTLQIETTGEGQQADKELLDEIVLEPRETRVISLYAVCHHAGTIKVTHLTYNFLSLLHISESLAVKGPRLYQSVSEQREIAYGPDTYLTIQIQMNRRRLDLSLNRSSTSLLRKFVLGAGECAEMKITLRNAGPGQIDDIWILHSPSIWLNLDHKDQDSKPSQIPNNIEKLQSDNALTNLSPILVPLETLNGSPVLDEGDAFDIPCMVHASQNISQDLFIMAIFRQRNQQYFFSSKLHQTLQVNPILECGVVARPSHKPNVSYEVLLEVRNLSETSSLTVSQVTCASPSWKCSLEGSDALQIMPPLFGLQFGRLFFLVEPSGDIERSLMVEDMAVHRLRGILLGEPPDPSPFPPVDILFSHLSKSKEPISMETPGHLDLLHSSWRTYMTDTLLYQLRDIFPDSFDKVLPLWNLRRMSIVVFWEIPEEGRRGFVTIPGITLGACHAPLEEIIHNSGTSNVKRTMYAETTREKAVIQDIIQSSEWNTEMNPLVVQVSTGSPQITHDFSQGECTVPVYFTIRNFSLTNYARFTLRLPTQTTTKTSEAQNLAPCYMGALTRRGSLKPGESATVQVKMWVTRPGIYGLDGWKLETEVGEKELEPWITRAGYVQEVDPNEGNVVIIVEHP